MRIIALCTFLPACTVGPDYVPPEPDMPEAWSQSLGVSEAEKTEARRPRWWRELGDEQLNALLRKAIEKNPTLGITAARINQSLAVVQQVSGQFLPDLDGTGGFSRFRQSEQASIFPVQDTSQWSLGLSVFWELDLFGRIRRSNESAMAALQASVEDYNDVLVVLQAQVASTYVQLRTLQRRIAYLKENITLQEASRDLAKARFETQIAPELDVFQAESNLANTQAQLPGLELELSRAMHRLAVLLGEHAGTLNNQLSTAKPIPTAPTSIDLGLPAELLRRRPDIRRAERDLAAQTARVGIAESALYPRLSLTGTLGLAAFDIDRLFTRRSRTFDITPGFGWNLLDGGLVRGAIREEEALTIAARIAYDNTVLLAVEETENAIATFRRLREQRTALQRVVTASRRSAELAQETYKQGLRSFQNVLDAQRTLFIAQDALADSEGAVVLATIDVYRALGGGWMPPPQPEQKP